ncbi:hypothetical protein NE237_003898 [Protea cynaroides]|uniref:Uncharacterized protein n=1 Tax=Protea cynaroides TaxID=273540 RepID=A0A9Q0QT57_9MAGN|nr:hypothetical protein NE237_003898 [Protea cynaroides]
MFTAPMVRLIIPRVSHEQQGPDNGPLNAHRSSHRPPSSSPARGPHLVDSHDDRPSPTSPAAASVPTTEAHIPSHITDPSSVHTISQNVLTRKSLLLRKLTSFSDHVTYSVTHHPIKLTTVQPLGPSCFTEANKSAVCVQQ